MRKALVAFLVMACALLQMLSGCGDREPDWDRKLETRLVVASEYDSAQGLTRVAMLAAGNEDLRIRQLTGIQTGRRGEVTLETGSDLPDSGLLRPGETVDMTIEDQVIRDLDLYAIAVVYEDAAQRMMSTKEILLWQPKAVAKLPTETTWYVFAPAMLVGDSVRVVITADIAGHQTVLDTVLTTETDKAAPTVTIRKDWVVQGYYLRTKRAGEPWSATYSLKESFP